MILNETTELVNLYLKLADASKSDFYSLCSAVYPALLPIL